MPRTKIAVVGLVGLAASIVVDLLTGQSLPGYSALFGFVSCVLIVLVSKWAGKVLLQRREDYYEVLDD